MIQKSGIQTTGILLFFIFLAGFFAPQKTSAAVSVNEDGRALISASERAFQKDMNKRPVITDKIVTDYTAGVVRRLVPEGRIIPKGINISVAVLESVQPDLYSYTSGRIVLTTGTLLAMDNEAQLAGILSREVANIVEGYYITMYQNIKAAEREKRRQETASALLGALLDVAVDYSVDYASYDLRDKWYRGDATYKETMQSVVGLRAARSAYYSIKDVVENIPAKDEKNQWVDPRLRLEPVADAQGIAYTALAGYDVRQASKGWDNLYREKQRLIRESEAAMGPWADQIRESRRLMDMHLERMQQDFGIKGLVRTRGSIPPTRAQFVAELENLKEVKEAQQIVGTSSVGQENFHGFLSRFFVPRAQSLMEDENYENAWRNYQAVWDKGIRTAAVAFGIAKCKLGDFAFSATEKEKKEAEKAYLTAIKMDPGFALAHKGLGELYEDWERYGDAAKSYQNYLKLNPEADDKKRIQRKIKTCKKRADR